MAEFLSSSAPEPGNLRKLLITGLVVAAILAAGFGIFYHHENHVPIQASVSRVLTLPLHATFSHTGLAGEGEEDDVIYVVPLLRIENHSDVPLFVKDIAGTVTLPTGGENDGRLVGARDRERLQQLVPTVAPVLKQANLPALDPERQIAPNTTVEGYAVFLFGIPESTWQKRQSASVRIDFYHQDSITIPLPKG